MGPAGGEWEGSVGAEEGEEDDGQALGLGGLRGGVEGRRFPVGWVVALRKQEDRCARKHLCSLLQLKDLDWSRVL